MENEDMVRSVYESIICSLTLQIADLKIKLRQQEKKYEDLDQHYNSPYINQTKKFDLMTSQNITAQKHHEIEILLNRCVEESEFELSTRAKNSLKAEKIYYIGDLVKCTERDLLRIQNIAKITLKEIKEFLAKYSLSLNMDVSWWIRPAF